MGFDYRAVKQKPTIKNTVIIHLAYVSLVNRLTVLLG